jgi:aspartate racemase
VGDAILGESRKPGVRHIGLVGTRFTLENDFLLNRPARGNHLWRARIFIPKESDRERLDTIIYGELCTGLVRENARADILRMARELREDGARIVVLASSELSTALWPEDLGQGILDSTELHALMAARWAVGERPKADYRSLRASPVPGAPLTKG